MEAATKNKRGRPKVFDGKMDADPVDRVDHRQNVNLMYAIFCADNLLNQREGDFFISDKGAIRRVGIAEQIGRLWYEGLATDEECKELARKSIEDYQNGQGVKQIEQRLRNLRIWREAKRKAEP